MLKTSLKIKHNYSHYTIELKKAQDIYTFYPKEHNRKYYRSGKLYIIRVSGNMNEKTLI